MKPFIIMVVKNIEQLEKALSEDQVSLCHQPHAAMVWDKFQGLTAKSDSSSVLAARR